MKNEDGIEICVDANILEFSVIVKWKLMSLAPWRLRGKMKVKCLC